MTGSKAGRALRMLFVMDPIDAVDIDADTTFALMLEAQRRGHTVLYCELGDLSVGAEGPRAQARPVALQRRRGAHAELGPPRSLHLDRDVEVAFQRADPPVHGAYIAATQILSLCRRTVVLNRPASLLARNEKLYALHFPELMPETRVARSTPELLSFLDALDGTMIAKPLDGKGGEGIFLLRRDDPNLTSILEQVTGFGTRWVMAQRYLPEIRAGDKRILLLEGDILGAVLRVPRSGETRANFHAGGVPAAAPIEARDREIAARLAPELLADGLFFVGIDVIGGYLTEINVTSPTGLQEIEALGGGELAAAVIARVETRVPAPG